MAGELTGRGASLIFSAPLPLVSALFSTRSSDPTAAAMKRLFQALAIFVAVWVLGSFLGVMFDPARANIWTQSLMWALLASVILAPVFIFIGTSPDSQSSAPRSPQAEQSFEVDERVDVNKKQEEVTEQEGWPYTS